MYGNTPYLVFTSAIKCQETPFICNKRRFSAQNSDFVLDTNGGWYYTWGMKSTGTTGEKKTGRTGRAYLRVSHEESASTRLGLDAQRNQIQEWAAANGVEIVAFYEDAPLSGATPVEKRDGLSSLLEDIRPGETLIIANLSRLARSVMIHSQVEEVLEASGCQLISCNGEGTGKKSSSNMMFKGIQVLMSAVEREQVRERTIAALNVLREQGVKLGHAPLGLKMHNGDWVEDEKTIHIRERMIQLRKEGFGWSKIARILNEEGHQTKMGKKFYPTTIKQYFGRGHTLDPWNNES